MLSQCESLVQATESRYATDDELIFLLHYRKFYAKRLSLYKKIERLERSIIETTYREIQKKVPQILRNRKQDISKKWKQDTLRTIRYCAMAVLLDDPENLRERYLLWFQTIMGAFNSRQSCDVTYSIMQEVVRELFTTEELELLVPILQLVQDTLGTMEGTQFTKL
ncbi:MAG: phycobilisome protein [Cyanothece sp. SIO2G6]|nr:phycobilisome protein [Cyanothece sp. SIO2G6]